MNHVPEKVDRAELELQIVGEAGGPYGIGLRFLAKQRQGRGGGDELRWWEDGVAIDPIAFGALATTEEYGRMLWQSVFERQPELLATYRKARSLADEVRFRVLILPAELQQLHWEKLYDPAGEGFVACSQNVQFARYLQSRDPDELGLRNWDAKSALVVVASPTDVTERAFQRDAFESRHERLEPLDVDGELARAADVLTGLSPRLVVKRLHRGSDIGNPNLNGILKELRAGLGHDVLFLVCHGGFDPDRGEAGEYFLLLESDDGRSQRVYAEELKAGLLRLRKDQRPRLVVLASCQSAGNGYQGALRALGPLLATHGTPAVLAMQGDVTIDTARAFLTTFFEELREHGKVDLAATVARGQVFSEPDWWAPALYSRLKQPDLITVRRERDNVDWVMLGAMVRAEEVVPILGPGVSQYVFESREQIALTWLEELVRQGELRRVDVGDATIALERVAQLAITARGAQMRNDVESSLILRLQNYLVGRYGPQKRKEELLQRRYSEAFARLEREGSANGASPPPGLDAKDRLDAAFTEHYTSLRRERPHDLSRRDLWSMDLDALVSAIGEQEREQDASEPHRLLARLPFPLYINTNVSRLLIDALEESGRTPVEFAYPWRERKAYERSHGDDRLGDLKEVPMVFHPFGRLSQADTVVLSEDDYLDHLAHISVNRGRIVPAEVTAAIAKKRLLFIGFDLNDLAFRALLFALFSGEQENTGLAVAVQIDPGGGEDDVHDIHAQLSNYLTLRRSASGLAVYWGTVSRFLTKLDAEVNGPADDRHRASQMST